MREGEGGAGWTGEAVQPKTRGHPLLEQKEILRGYLRQVGAPSSGVLIYVLGNLDVIWYVIRTSSNLSTPRVYP